MVKQDGRAGEGGMALQTAAKTTASRLSPSHHIGDATFDKNLCETLVAVSHATSHRSLNKDSGPLFRLLLLIILTATLTGCLWHGESVDHVWGPTLFRNTAPPDGQAYLAEQTWLPLLVEGGTRWGITIGYFSKLLSVPLSIRRSDGTVELSPPFSWHSTIPITFGSWKISLFHTSLKQTRKVEFIGKRLVGIQLSTGFDKEGSNMTLGTSHITRFWPRPDALYLLEFSSRYPLTTRFLACEAKGNDSLEPCLQKVIQ